MSQVTVSNKRDAYMWEWILKDKMLLSNGVTEKNLELIKEIKRELRKFYHRPIDERRVFDNDFDHATFVYALPEDIKTREEAQEYFEEYEYIPYRPTYYDCTGQSFTSWYKIFQKPNGSFWCYHNIQVDC